jgi:hypothetical protein
MCGFLCGLNRTAENLNAPAAGRLPGSPILAPRLDKIACVSPLALPIPHRVTNGRSPWPHQDKTRLLEPLREDIRQSATWRRYFRGFQKPYVHLTPEAYQALAAQHGLRVIALQLKAEAWDFKTREAFLAFCLTTCVEWTRLLPEDKRQAFITEVLNRYRTVAADIPQEENIFKFYQLEVVLVPTGEAGWAC